MRRASALTFCLILILLLGGCGGPRISGNETYVTVTPADDEAEALPDAQKRCGTYGRIAHFKVPHYIRFVDSFPMTVTGKIQKFRIREQEIEARGLTQAASIKTA